MLVNAKETHFVKTWNVCDVSLLRSLFWALPTCHHAGGPVSPCGGPCDPGEEGKCPEWSSLPCKGPAPGRGLKALGAGWWQSQSLGAGWWHSQSPVVLFTHASAMLGVWMFWPAHMDPSESSSTAPHVSTMCLRLKMKQSLFNSYYQKSSLIIFLKKRNILFDLSFFLSFYFLRLVLLVVPFSCWFVVWNWPRFECT